MGQRVMGHRCCEKESRDSVEEEDGGAADCPSASNALCSAQTTSSKGRTARRAMSDNHRPMHGVSYTHVINMYKCIYV